MPDRFYSHCKWLSALLLVLAGLNFVWMGCGRKGSPRPPQRPLPPAVKDLSYAIYGDWVELSWAVPTAEGKKTASPFTVKVLRSRLTAEEAGCKSCPVRFAVSADIPIHRKRSERARPIPMSYAENIEPGYRYIYKVIVFDQYGFHSKDSNIVDFDHPSN